VSAARKAAARRARLRELLRAKTQADATPTQSELLRQLGADVGLRTLKRDLALLRGSVTKGTHSTRARGVNRPETGSNMSVTKKLKQLDERLDAIENAQRHLVDFLAKITDFAVESRENDMTLLRLHNEAAAEHAELKKWHDMYIQEQSQHHEVH